MSYFKKLVKGSGGAGSNASQQSLPTNEEKSKISKLEEQIKYLNAYIQELAKENEIL
jgi:hypothetical protein